MSDKCFCHLNGYEVKDKKARETLETLSAGVANKIDKVAGTRDYETVVTRSKEGNYYLTDISHDPSTNMSIIKRRANGTAGVNTLADGDTNAKPTDIINREFLAGKLANLPTGGGNKLYQYQGPLLLNLLTLT